MEWPHRQRAPHDRTAAVHMAWKRTIRAREKDDRSKADLKQAENAHGRNGVWVLERDEGSSGPVTTDAPR